VTSMSFSRIVPESDKQEDVRMKFHVLMQPLFNLHEGIPRLIIIFLNVHL